MLRESQYSRFDTNNLSLGDVLAVDRNVLANERTLLGYIRTALALLAAGGSLLHFFEGRWTTLGGLAFLGSGALIVLVGVLHYIRRRRALRLIGSSTSTHGPDSSAHSDAQ